MALASVLAMNEGQAAVWTTNGPLTLPRQVHTTTLLPNNKVLITGGLVP